MKNEFPKEFLWGAATAAFQIEGGAKEDGKGESIWDKFCRTPGKVFNFDNGDVACDHFHRFKEDVKMMKDLGLDAYRLSISWPRIYPEGKGEINQKGIDFYKRLINEIKENGIEPFVTLYHWDLPQKLQDIGGWDNSDITDYFAEYAKTMFESLGDVVKHWTTLNEPFVSAYLGYGSGIHAPGIKDDTMAVRVSHNLILAHAKAVKAYRMCPNNNGKIGVVLNVSPAYSNTNSIEDKKATMFYDGWFNRWFLDPCLLGKYPEDILEIYQNAYKAPVIINDDMEIIKSNVVDFIGINYYSSAFIKHSSQNKVLGFEECMPKGPVTDMGWEIYPDGMYDILSRLRKDYGNPDVYITENGAAFCDTNVVDGIVEDLDRVDYLEKHFEQAHKALVDGSNLKGYFVWSLMDNFEWAHGYSKRFGIVHVDYKTLKRTPKRSALWFKEFIKN